MMPLDERPIAVFYLSYVPFGVRHLKEFLVSYLNYTSGTSHELTILFNGHSNESELIIFKNYLESSGVEYSILISPEKFDIGSYFFAASQKKNKYLLFLNTYTRILHANWLYNLYNCVQKTEVGVVGCTGAWSDFGGNHLHLGSNLLKRLYSWIVYRFNFYPHIKPHLRTNAFLINRDIFLSLKYNYPKPSWLFFLKSGLKETKLRSFCFEHGNNSMTNQILRKGLDVLIVDKNGKSYSIDNWKKSNTFWNGEQENLIVQDNQTLYYTNGTELYKATLRFKAWNILRNFPYKKNL
jgi:hypothetical protein